MVINLVSFISFGFVRITKTTDNHHMPCGNWIDKQTNIETTTTKETTQDATPEPDNANEHKERGNECIRKANYSEAILHYSFAIKLSPTEATFYSNRSLAFLKCNQLYYANEDADKAIQLKPDWAKVNMRARYTHTHSQMMHYSHGMNCVVGHEMNVPRSN